MVLGNNESTILTIYARPCQGSKVAFFKWQEKMHAEVAAFPGFVSIEMVFNPANNEWMIVQRFDFVENLNFWRESTYYRELIEELKNSMADNVREIVSNLSNFQGGVLEVLVTHVNPGKEKDYREWIAKIHEVEAKFPGFRRAYVQSPSTSLGNWITLLQFDTPEHLDQWLSSSEREEILKESSSLIKSLENHRVISPYAGWFSSIVKAGGEPPAVWKQTMLVLLVLFPIVMLEFKLLLPLTQSLNLSLATFIGNAISVSLVSWPMMPIVIWLLNWWLLPQNKSVRSTLLGIAVVLLLYVIEIAIFWKL